MKEIYKFIFDLIYTSIRYAVYMMLIVFAIITTYDIYKNEEISIEIYRFMVTINSFIIVYSIKNIIKVGINDWNKIKETCNE